MKKILAMTIFLAVGSLCCPGQENVQIKRGPAAKSQAPPVFLDFSQSD